MSVDTRDKRGSCIGYSWPNRGHVWPNPSGSLASQGQRQQLAYRYAGVLTAALVTFLPTTLQRLTGVGQ